jgi:hypothetical protein
MAKLSDAERLARLFEILDHLSTVDRATVGELAELFGGSVRSLYEDLVAAWLAEDPRHMGMFPLHLHLEYFEPGEPGYQPVADRHVWVSGHPGTPRPPRSETRRIKREAPSSDRAAP